MIQLVNEIYGILGFSQDANLGDVYGVMGSLFLIISSISILFKKSEGVEEEAPSIKKSTMPVDASPAKEEVKTPPKAVEPQVSWRDRLSKGLSRSHKEVWGKVFGLFGGKELSEDLIEDIEELLYSADIGPSMVGQIISHLEEKVKEPDFDEEAFKTFLFDFMHEKMAPIQQKNTDSDLFNFDPEKSKLKVIMIVGVNGAGKTTTIGKLATRLTRQGAKVVVGACDTFRAAAVDQLEVWCERAGAKMIRAKEGASPSGVGYDALQTAVNEGANYCILDTAGRLHTASNLMDELSKSKNVLKKIDENAPHHTLLVLDAISGQNALKQAEEFNKALGLTGLIFTKCDGTSKAGGGVSIVEALKVPITYIGVGESVEDLDEFVLDDYLKALLHT